MLHICHSHGMPSSHTSMMSFYLTITSCWAVQLWSRRSSISKLLSAGEQLFCSAAAVAVAASRVYLGYHSLDQVIAGAAVGSVFGLLWMAVIHSASTVYCPVSGVRLFQQLGVKDTYLCAESLLVEQKAHRRAAAAGPGKID